MSLNREVYGKLLSEVQPKVIETEQENEYFLAEIEKIMNLGEGNATPEQDALLEVMVRLVEEFEDKHYQLGVDRNES